MTWFSTVGLALASTLAVVAQAWFLQSRLTRRLAGLGFAPLLPNLVKIAIASGLMGVVVWGGLRALAALALSNQRHDWLVVGGLIPVAGLVYGALLWLLKIEGRAELAALLGKVRAKFV